MINESDYSLLTSLRQMINCCREIQKLLKNDRAHFSKDDISEIEKSNKNKTILLENLSTLLNELNNHSPKNQSTSLLAALESKASEFDKAARDQLNVYIQELKLEIAGCYECLMVNSKVVYTHLRQLSGLWEKLMSSRKEIHYVYDHKGVTK